MMAAAGQHAAVVKVLLQAGAAVHLTDAQGVGALERAAEAGRTGTVQLLMQHGAVQARRPVLQDSETDMASPDSELAAATEDSTADCEASAIQALVIVASLGHAAVVRVLLDAGVPADAPDSDGGVALLSAAAGGHAAAVRLLSAGASCTLSEGCTYEDGTTVLALAAADEHGVVVQQLLDAGAHAEGHAAGAQGRMAVMRAAVARLAKVVNCLHSARAVYQYISKDDPEKCKENIQRIWFFAETLSTALTDGDISPCVRMLQCLQEGDKNPDASAEREGAYGAGLSGTLPGCRLGA